MLEIKMGIGMSIRTLFSKKLDQLENVIKVSGEHFEKITNDLSAKAKKLNSPYRIKCEELERLIAFFEEYNEMLESYKKFFPNFSIDEYMKSGKLLENSNDDDFLNFDKNYFECIRAQQNTEVKIRELADKLWGKDIAILDVMQIKDYLYKNWKFK